MPKKNKNKSLLDLFLQYLNQLLMKKNIYLLNRFALFF